MLILFTFKYTFKFPDTISDNIITYFYSYAGLHCKEIKGHSKSVGYEPGMRIEPESFQNTWNAVLIDGDWRLVQCNWGARCVLYGCGSLDFEKGL